MKRGIRIRRKEENERKKKEKVHKCGWQEEESRRYR
jgi:hypothetical protein